MPEKTPTIETIIQQVQSYTPHTDTHMLKAAFNLAAQEAGDLLDVEGKVNRPIIEHLLKCAQIAADMKLDIIIVTAALLHDVWHHGNATPEDVENFFGKEIRVLIEDLLLIAEIEQKNQEFVDTEALSRAILASPRDIRAIFLKLSTQAERMRIIAQHPHDMQVKLVSSSLNICAPIAHKLGLQNLKWELEDYSLKVLNPKAYNQIKEKLCIERDIREKELGNIRNDVNGLMRKNGFTVTVYARLKHFYSIHKKMHAGKRFGEIEDLRGVRIICDSVKQCYEILGVIHSSYLPIPQSFHDYIAIPKQNGYQCIHTTIIWNRKPVEVQIRTWDMHFDAESGVPAHWRYKQFSQDKYFDRKLSWAKQLVEWQQSYPNAQAFLTSVKLDFGEKQVFVFTPQKQVIILPEHATPVDFAFAIHSDVGVKCKQAKINGEIVPLHHELKNGDMVDILPGKTTQVKRNWLTFVKSRKAILHVKKVLGIHARTPAGEDDLHVSKPQHKPQRLRLARCCNPLPSDDISGYRTAKRKITIHRKDCTNLVAMPAENITPVSWDMTNDEYNVSLQVNARDRPGLLNDVLSRLAANNATINTTHTNINKNNTASCEFDIKVKGLQQLEKIIKEIEQVPDIYTVARK
jgi:GTP diphosphokinase / guanosine-3',5'-bis(diphosphate) 3'-diphosphatase